MRWSWRSARAESSNLSAFADVHQENLTKTHLEVSFSELETILVMGTFDGVLALASNVLAMAGVLLGQAENGVDCL